MNDHYLNNVIVLVAVLFPMSNMQPLKLMTDMAIDGKKRTGTNEKKYKLKQMLYSVHIKYIYLMNDLYNQVNQKQALHIS